MGGGGSKKKKEAEPPAAQPPGKDPGPEKDEAAEENGKQQQQQQQADKERLKQQEEQQLAEEEQRLMEQRAAEEQQRLAALEEDRQRHEETPPGKRHGHDASTSNGSAFERQQRQKREAEDEDDFAAADAVLAEVEEQLREAHQYSDSPPPGLGSGLDEAHDNGGFEYGYGGSGNSGHQPTGGADTWSPSPGPGPQAEPLLHLSPRTPVPAAQFSEEPLSHSGFDADKFRKYNNPNEKANNGPFGGGGFMAGSFGQEDVPDSDGIRRQHNSAYGAKRGPKSATSAFVIDSVEDTDMDSLIHDIDLDLA